MEYENKTYKEIILIIIAMLLTIPIITSLTNLDNNVLSKLIFSNILGYLCIIGNIIYKKERIYWITSYSYKDTLNMSKQERKEIGLRFFKTVTLIFMIFLLYSIIGWILDLSIMIDALIFTVLIIVIAFKA